jgi:hypothetical protein
MWGLGPICFPKKSPSYHCHLFFLGLQMQKSPPKTNWEELLEQESVFLSTQEGIKTIFFLCQTFNCTSVACAIGPGVNSLPN